MVLRDPIKNDYVTTKFLLITNILVSGIAGMGGGILQFCYCVEYSVALKFEEGLSIDAEKVGNPHNSNDLIF